MVEKVTGRPTQTRRDVRSESISATCIMESRSFDGVSGMIELGGRLDSGSFRYGPKAYFISDGFLKPPITRGVGTACYTKDCSAVFVDTRSMASIKANARKVICIGRNYAFVFPRRPAHGAAP